MGHWWQAIRYGSNPSGQDTLWRCRRCKSETTFWKEPDSNLKVRKDVPPASYHDIGPEDDWDDTIYTCEELIVAVVHDA